MGRPRRFDESDLLDAAAELFWTRGFDETSIEDIARAGGVGNGSIYAAYGSKKGLFLAALEHYCQARAAFVRDVVTGAPGTARTAARTLLRADVDDCAAHPDRRGCLMLNAVAHLGARIPEVGVIGRRTTAAMEDAVTARLRTHLDAEETVLAAHGAALVVTAQGLIHAARLGTPTPRLHAIADIACAAIPQAPLISTSAD